MLGRIINFDLMREPYNWLIVILMMTSFAMMLMLVIQPAQELETGTLSVI